MWSSPSFVFAAIKSVPVVFFPWSWTPWSKVIAGQEWPHATFGCRISPPPLSFSFILSSLLSTSAGFHLLKQKLTVLLGARSRASLFLQERWENKHGAWQYLLSLPGSHLQHRHSAAGEAVLSPYYTPPLSNTAFQSNVPLGQACLSASLPTTWWNPQGASNSTCPYGGGAGQTLLWGTYSQLWTHTCTWFEDHSLVCSVIQRHFNLGKHTECYRGRYNSSEWHLAS